MASENVVPAPSIRAHGSNVSVSAPPGATVFYTLDGRDPTPASPEFPKNGSLDLGIGQLIIKAIALRGGIGSQVATHFYAYTPQALLITPDAGTYEVNTSVTIAGEHEEVRYTLDGTIPTQDSPRYSGPLSLSKVGQICLTAAMFSDGLPLGEPVRKQYTIHGATVKAPIVTPKSGTYECPLRITVQAEGDIRYTLDGEAPTLATGQHYNGPLLISTPNDVYLKVCAFNNGRQSAVVVERFQVTPSTANDNDNKGGAATSVFPAANVAYDGAVEDSARAKAEEVMAWLLAATEMKERRQAEATQLERELYETKDRYRDAIKRLEQVNKSLNLANVHRVKLEEVKQTHVCSVAMDLQNQMAETLARKEELALREHSIDSQLQEALSLHNRLVNEMTQTQNQAKEAREALERKFLNQKRMLAGYDPEIAQAANELEMVVAEQRNEIRILRATVDALENPGPANLATAGDEANAPFLKPQRAVELPKVEALVPVPPGMMRRITTVQGNGLQILRKKHCVDACIVQNGATLGIKVVGHSAGVFGFTEEAERLLREE